MRFGEKPKFEGDFLGFEGRCGGGKGDIYILDQNIVFFSICSQFPISLSHGCIFWREKQNKKGGIFNGKIW